MAGKPLQITTPVGRLVGGNLYEPKTTDDKGQPLLVKTGANKGKQRSEYSFGVAFPKTAGVTHWASEQWLANVWALGHAAFPNGEAQRPDFAWKITDGDSAVPNKKGVKPNSREGYPGHWVVWFSSGTAPRIFNANGTQLLLDKDVVKCGYYVQVFGNVTDNIPSESPGVYWNHSMVAFAGIGPEISFGPDVSQAGFGQGVALPAGAVAYTGQPVAPAPGVPVTGVTPPAPPGAAVAAPPPPAAPAPAPVEQMIEGTPLSQWIASGWTVEMLVQHGKMAAPAPAVAVPPPLPVGSVPAPAAPAPTVVAPPPLPVTPNPDMRGVPGAIAPPPAAPAPVAERIIEGRPLSQWIASGWTEALLIQHGKMTA